MFLSWSIHTTLGTTLHCLGPSQQFTRIKPPPATTGSCTSTNQQTGKPTLLLWVNCITRLTLLNTRHLWQSLTAKIIFSTVKPCYKRHFYKRHDTFTRDTCLWETFEWKLFGWISYIRQVSNTAHKRIVSWVSWVPFVTKFYSINYNFSFSKKSYFTIQTPAYLTNLEEYAALDSSWLERKFTPWSSLSAVPQHVQVSVPSNFSPPQIKYPQ